MSKLIVASLAGVLALLPPWRGSDCVAVTVSDAKRAAILVFEGTVTSVTVLKHPERQAVFRVHRAWKGNVGEDVTAHYAESVEGPMLNVGDRRIVFAVRHTPEVGKVVGTGDGVRREFWVPPCSGAWNVDESVVKQLGRPIELRR